MMAEIKKGMKLIRYGYGLKMNLAVAVIFFIVGILMLCVGESGLMLGTIYILLAPTMLIQLESSLLYSGMAAASSKRRLLEVALPDFLTIVTGVVGYVVVVGAGWFWASVGQESTDTCMEIMLGSGMVVAIMLIYFGAAYKYFFTSVIMFMFGLVIGISGGIVTIRLVGKYFTMLTVSLLCLALVVIGTLISCWLRRVFYRKQISPMAGGMSLRKAMQ